MNSLLPWDNNEFIKDYLINFHDFRKDLTINLRDGKISAYSSKTEDWTVHLIDREANTQTGGRLKRLAKGIGDETFMMTYGDGVGDIDIVRLIKQPFNSGKYDDQLFEGASQ